MDRPGITGYVERTGVPGPEIDTEEGETVADKQYLPIDRRVFEKMSRYGRNQPLQAAVIVGPKRPEGG